MVRMLGLGSVQTLGHEEFAALMAPLGPWGADRRVAVAVSGGADSLCLALLTRAWGNPVVFIIDHGLRAASAAEAAWTACTVRARGMPARIITLTGLRGGSSVAARARAARYDALTRACREAGLVDLLLGHHAADQAETVLMRRRSGSGPAGLAGMAAVVEQHSVRLVRPLLGIAPQRLRQTLRVGAQPWLEDPSNTNPQATRTRLRAELNDGGVPDTGRGQARTRAIAEAAAAAELARRAMIHPAGFAIVSPGPIGSLALGTLLRAIAGHAYVPPPGAVASLATDLRPATLGGVRLLPAGRLGRGWLLVREAAAMEAPIPLVGGVVWDGRFQVSGLCVGARLSGCTLGPLGSDAARFRRSSPWPAAVLFTMPAVRRNNVLSVVQHLSYGLQGVGGDFRLRHAGLPACSGPFVAF